jgi:AmmeMemoRadiSam system protein B
MKIPLLSNRFKIKFAALLILFIVLVSFGAFLFFSKNKKAPTVYHQSQWNEYFPEVERALAKDKNIQPIVLNHVYGGVVSHHIPTTIPQLVEFYSRLKQTQSVKKIIIIGPDHNGAGKTPVIVSGASFFSSYGELKPIEGLAVKLQNTKLVSIDEPPFEMEHSIGSQMLIIHKIFPDVQVTPIIIRSDTAKEHAEALGKALANFIDEETILIASIDFSHYLSTDQASPLDKISGDIIQNLDGNSLSLIKADSNKTAAVFIEAMNQKQARDTMDVKVLNTNDLMQNSDYTTGYVFGYWGKK